MIRVKCKIGEFKMVDTELVECDDNRTRTFFDLAMMRPIGRPQDDPVDYAIAARIMDGLEREIIESKYKDSNDPGAFY